MPKLIAQEQKEIIELGIEIAARIDDAGGYFMFSELDRGG
jgi:hypothetical protein